MCASRIVALDSDGVHADVQHLLSADYVCVSVVLNAAFLSSPYFLFTRTRHLLFIPSCSFFWRRMGPCSCPMVATRVISVYVASKLAWCLDVVASSAPSTAQLRAILFSCLPTLFPSFPDVVRYQGRLTVTKPTARPSSFAPAPARDPTNTVVGFNFQNLRRQYQNPQDRKERESSVLRGYRLHLDTQKQRGDLSVNE